MWAFYFYEMLCPKTSRFDWTGWSPGELWGLCDSVLLWCRLPACTLVVLSQFKTTAYCVRDSVIPNKNFGGFHPPFVYQDATPMTATRPIIGLVVCLCPNASDLNPTPSAARPCRQRSQAHQNSKHTRIQTKCCNHD